MNISELLRKLADVIASAEGNGLQEQQQMIYFAKQHMVKLFVSVLALYSSIAIANPYDFPITRVVDGDTVKIEAVFLPKELKQELSVRVYGVDTPEKGALAKCQAERDKGAAASKFTVNAINSSTDRKILIHGWDKYGGRILGDVILDGVSLRDLLIQNNLAKPYFGGTKESWCK